MKKVILACVFLIIGGLTTLQAQKFGYLDSESLLSLVPEVQQAESDLKAFQQQLQKRGQTMLQDAQATYNELLQKKEQGLIAPKAYEDGMAALEAEQVKIQKFEQEMYQQISARREELLKPVLDKLNADIEAVAKANGYQYIFDGTKDLLLYADEALDITPLLKAKLGIK